MPPLLRKLHRCSGLVLAAFVLAHLFNHLLLAVDVPAAFAFMAAFRQVYRYPAIEALLLAAVLAQGATGLALARRQPHAGPASRLSGYYLLFFLLVHVAAVLWGRLGMGLDTDIRFAASGLRAWPSAAFFVPYYFLAVLAVCIHAGLGIGTFLAAPRRAALAASAALGIAIGVAIVGGMLALVA